MKIKYQYEGCSINSWTTFINQKRAREYFYNAHVSEREIFPNKKVKFHFIQALMLEDLIIRMTLGYGRWSNGKGQEN